MWNQWTVNGENNVLQEGDLIIAGWAWVHPPHGDLTWSSYVLQLWKTILQIDAWDFQWNTPLNEELNLFGERISYEALIRFLTHLHIDHCAAAPVEQKHMWKVSPKYYMTSETKHWLVSTFEDAYWLQSKRLKQHQLNNQKYIDRTKKKELLERILKDMEMFGVESTIDLLEIYIEQQNQSRLGKSDKSRANNMKRKLFSDKNNLIKSFSLENNPNKKKNKKSKNNEFSLSKSLSDMYIYQSKEDVIKDIEKYNLKIQNLQGTQWDIRFRKYEEEHFKQVVKNAKVLEQGKELQLKDSLSAEFFETGHITGSVWVLLKSRSRKKEIKYLFSWDIGRKAWTMYTKPYSIPKVKDIDVCVLECTYGNRLHSQTLMDALEEVRKCVVHHQWPKMLLALSYEKSPILIHYLLHNTDLKIEYYWVLGKKYIDSVFVKHRSELYKSIVNNVRVGRNSTVSPDILHKQFSDPNTVIVASSGMLLWPSYWIAMELASIPDSLIIATNYLPPSTPWYFLREHKKIYNSESWKNMHFQWDFKQIYGMSWHGDQNDLLHYAMTVNPKHLVLTHWDLEAKECFKKLLIEKGYQGEIYIPSNGDKLSFDL